MLSGGGLPQWLRILIGVLGGLCGLGLLVGLYFCIKLRRITRKIQGLGEKGEGGVGGRHGAHGHEAAQQKHKGSTPPINVIVHGNDRPLHVHGQEREEVSKSIGGGCGRAGQVEGLMGSGRQGGGG